MTVYLVTGATGFLGGELVKRLLVRDGATVYALVRPGSEKRLASKSRRWPNRDRVEVVNGDLTKDKLGMSAAEVKKLRGKVDHVVHLAALYDITTDDAINDVINIDGHAARRRTRQHDRGRGCLHHVSSVAVAGDYEGTFTEEMFDEGQPLPSPYHRTKFEAEKVVRTEANGAVAGVPAGHRRRRLADRRDRQGRRAVLHVPDAATGGTRPGRLADAHPGARPRAARTSCRSTTWSTRWTTSCTSRTSTVGRSSSSTRSRIR